MASDEKSFQPSVPCSDLVAVARANGLNAGAAEAVAKIDRLMSSMRRSMVKRDFGRRLVSSLDATLDVAHLDLMGAVVHLGIPESEGGETEVTVGSLAERLAVDPSRASRVAADLVERGYLLRVASQGDARRICLEATEKGRRFVEAVQETKWKMFSRALHNWEERDLVTFATLLERFSTWTSDAAE